MFKNSLKRKFENFEIKVTAEAIQTMEQESQNSKYVETGGVIVGKGNFIENNLILMAASLPGPKAIRRRFFFQRDHIFCQQFLDEFASNTNGEIDYLGEWHKHFEVDPKPSYQDIQTMQKVAQSSNYHVQIPLLLIIGITNLSDSLRIFAVFEDGAFQNIRWSILNPNPDINS